MGIDRPKDEHALTKYKQNNNNKEKTGKGDSRACMTRMNPPQTLPRLDDFFLFWRAWGVIVLNVRQKTHTHKNWNTMVIDAFYICEGGTFSSLFPQGPVKRHASKYS